MKKILAITAALLAVSSAQAAERPYIGVSAVQPVLELERSNPDTLFLNRENEFELDAVQFRGGVLLTRYIGLEAHVISGAGKAEGAVVDSVTGTRVGDEMVELDKAYGFHGVARMGVGKAGLYVYGGYTWASLDYLDTASATEMTEEEDGWSYGVGIDFPLFRGTNIELDYRSMLDEDNYTLSGLSLGLRRYL